MDVTAEILDRLCAHCDDEAERQETVLEVCRAQLAAARAHDLEQLEAKTAALFLLIKEEAEAEKGRLEILRSLVERLGLPVQHQTMSFLISVVPEPWASRLAEFQARLRATIAETQKTIRENNRIIRKSLRVLDQAVSAAVQCAPASPSAYDALGNCAATAGRHAAILDQSG